MPSTSPRYKRSVCKDKPVEDQDGGELGAAAAAAAKGKRRREAVTVTHIVTARVSADEASFRDVVQRLTGKDSAAARAAAVAGAAAAGRLLVVGGDAVVFEGTVLGGGDEAVVGLWPMSIH
uniref:VQ domain-containing protein n=1 Tax=Oryza meridionalis TaxID=40149 RepID=A0A1V1H6G0_9ORYZ|nr:hypothetical protein [Oryza meridionalis]